MTNCHLHRILTQPNSQLPGFNKMNLSCSGGKIPSYCSGGKTPSSCSDGKRPFTLNPNAELFYVNKKIYQHDHNAVFFQQQTSYQSILIDYVNQLRYGIYCTKIDGRNYVSSELSQTSAFWVPLEDVISVSNN